MRLFGKFALTGLGGVVVNLGSFQLMLTSGVHALLASPIAIELSIISNFLLNNYWTFGSRELSGKRRVRGLKYHLVSLATLFLSYGTFVLLSVLFRDVPLVILQGCAIAPAGVLNYSVNSLWTFREAPPGAADDVQDGTG
ncbi:MAG: GtrA family protein [Gemmatimonadota bacterium]|nr:GtrA family protein [Gemmatimonadota bacterium]